MPQKVAAARQARDLTAGLILVFTALVTLIVLAHHPVIKARETDELFTQIVKTAFADRLVHGALILFAIVQLFAFCRFARRQNIQRDACPPRAHFLLTWNGGDDWRSAG